MASPVKIAKQRAQILWPGCYVGQTPDMVSRGISARGRNYIVHVHPDNPNRAMLDTQVGGVGWHSGNGPFTEADEIDTAWAPSSGSWLWEMTHADFHAYLNNGSYRYIDAPSGEYVNLDVTALEWRNNERQTQNIPLVTVSPSANDDIITWEGLFGSGTRLQVQAQTARLAKYLRLATSTSLPLPTIGGTDIQLVFRFRLQRSSGVSIFVDGSVWNENTQIRTGSLVEFRLVSTGELVWKFMVPYATDASQTPAIVMGTQVLKKTGANLFVEVEIPYSWLQTAIYPVTIDPTIDPQVGASGDDGTWWATLFNSTNGYTDLGNNTVARNSFHRFTGVSLSGTVTTSYISVRAWGQSTVAINLKIRADDEDNPTAPTSNSDAAGRAQTTAGIDWDTGSTNWNEGIFYDSPSINSVIQELIDTYSISNEAIQIFILDDGSTTNNVRYGSPYDQNTTYGVKLHVEYTAGGSTVEESVTLAKFNGETALSQISAQDTISLAKFDGETALSQISAQDAISLAKSDGITIGEPVWDDFNRTDLGTNWEVGAGTVTITSNQLTCSVAEAKIWWIKNTIENDQWVAAKQYGSSWRGVTARVSGSGDNIYAYVAGISGIGASVSLRFWWHNGGTEYGEYLDAGSTTVSCMAGDILKLIVDGQDPNIRLRAYINGVLVKTLLQANFVNPAAILASGRVGLYFNAATVIFDDFSGGPIYGPVEERVTLAKFDGLIAEGIKEIVGIEEYVNLEIYLSVTQRLPSIIEETVTLSNFKGVSTVDQILIQDALILTKLIAEENGDLANVIDNALLAKFKNISSAMDVNILDAISLFRSVGQTSEAQTNENDIVDLVKFVGFATFEEREALYESVSLAKSLQATPSDQTDIQDFASLNKILSISELDELLIEDFSSFAKFNGILINDQLDIQELVSLLKSKVIGSDTQVEVSDSLTLVLLRDILVLEYIPGGVVEESISLGKSLSVTQRLPALQESVDLAKNLGISSLDEVNLQDSISLAKSLGIVEEYLLEIQELIILTRSNTITSIDEVIVQDQIILSKSLDIAVIGDISGIEENVSLAKSLQTTFSEQLDGQDLVSLNKILSISELDEVVIGDNVAFIKFAALVSNSDVIIQEVVSLLKTETIGTDTQAETYGSLTFAIFKAISISEETQGQYAETIILGRYAALNAFEEGISHVSESVILGRINLIDIIDQLKIDDFLTLVRSNGIELIGNCQINNSVLLNRLMTLSTYPNCYVDNYLSLNRSLTLNAISQLVINEATNLSKLNQLDLIDSRYLVESIALGYSNLLSLDNNLDIHENIELGRIDIVTLITILFGYNAISFNQFKSIIAEPPSLYVYNDGNHSVGVLFRDKRAEVLFRDKRVEVLFRDKRAEVLFRDRRGSVPWRDKRGD